MLLFPICAFTPASAPGTWHGPDIQLLLSLFKAHRPSARRRVSPSVSSASPTNVGKKQSGQTHSNGPRCVVVSRFPRAWAEFLFLFIFNDAPVLVMKGYAIAAPRHTEELQPVACGSSTRQVLYKYFETSYDPRLDVKPNCNVSKEDFDMSVRVTQKNVYAQRDLKVLNNLNNASNYVSEKAARKGSDYEFDIRHRPGQSHLSCRLPAPISFGQYAT